MVMQRRKEQRKMAEAQQKVQEENEIAMRKLGGSEVWEGRSASDEGSVRSGVEGDFDRHGDVEQGSVS